MAERSKVLMAASMIYAEMHKNHLDPVSNDEQMNDRMEEILVAHLNNAQHKLDSYRRTRGLRLALDSVMPGWKYIDASCYTPPEAWGTFVSNDKQEWFDWLIRNKVPSAKAAELVSEYFRGSR